MHTTKQENNIFEKEITKSITNKQRKEEAVLHVEGTKLYALS